MKKFTYKKTAVISAALALALFVGGWLHINGLGCPSVSFLPLPDPRVAADDFFSCIKQGDFDACSDYLYNSDSLNFSAEPQLAAGKKLKQGLIDNFDYSIGDIVEKNGATAVIQVQLTVLDLNLIRDDYKAKVMELVEEASWQGIDFHTEEFALDAAEEAVEQLLDDPERYCVTRSYEVQMYYVDSSWRIFCDSDLHNAILGTPLE